MPFGYGYARVTTTKQAIAGLSLEAQDDAIRAYFDYKLKGLGVEWGDIYVDRGLSAYKVPLRLRPAGGALLGRLKAGDHVVVTRLDRAFRRIADGYVELERMRTLGVTVHVITLGLDTSNAASRLVLSLLLAVAEHEREMAAERTAEVMAVRKRKGTRPNQHAGYGFMLAGRAGSRRVVPDPVERIVMLRIVQLHDGSNWRFEDVWLQFQKEGLRTRKGKLWSLARIIRAYKAELALRLKESSAISALTGTGTTSQEGSGATASPT